MKIKEIRLISENCDCVILSSEDFKGLIMYDITEQLDVNCYQHEDGTISKVKCAGYFSIKLLPKANEKRSYFMTIMEKKDVKLFDYIEGYSFTGIDLTYEDESQENYLISWVGDSDYDNEGQLSYRYFDEYANGDVLELYVIKDKVDREKTIKYSSWKNVIE